jgi:ribose 1,5-bisphosphokinase PhnN
MLMKKKLISIVGPTGIGKTALAIELAQDAAVVEAAYQDFGLHLVRTCLTRLGKSHGLEPRIFHEAASQQVQFGAVAQKEAAIQWHDAGCIFSPGDWLAMGSAQQFTAATLTSELAGFDVHETWRASDGRVDVMLLKKK